MPGARGRAASRSADTPGRQTRRSIGVDGPGRAGCRVPPWNSGGPARAQRSATGRPQTRGMGTRRFRAALPPARRARPARARPYRGVYRGATDPPDATGMAARHRTADAPTQETQKSWRRPIFPKGCPLSIFGAGELNFRVRDGNGCGLSARVTRISCVWFAFRQRLCSAQERSGRRKRDLQLRVVWASKNAQVDPDPRRWPLVSVGKVKPSTISTAWLHPLPGFHVPPIKQVVSLRSYPVNPVGNLISRRASHLDAFSAYPNRT